MTPPCPDNEPQPDLLHQLFLEMSNLDQAKDRATLLDLYKRVRASMVSIIENDPHPNQYTQVLTILNSADTLARELFEDMDLTTFRRLKEHMREANYALTS